MTTIAYDKPVKDLISELSATGHVTHTSFKKKSVTLHHNGGRLSHEGVLNVWKTRPASAQFDVDRVGALAQYVKVNEYAWAAGNTTGNIESIHIEMANYTLAPTWQVADVTWHAAARLAGWLFAHVIDGRPMPSRSNFFYHHHWKSTLCAGPFMDSIYNKVLEEAQSWYKLFMGKPAVDLTIDARALNYAATGKGFNAGDVWFHDCLQFMAWACHRNIAIISTETRDTYERNTLRRDFAAAGKTMKDTIRKAQAKFHVTPDGIVGPTTARVLRGYGYTITGTA